MKLLNDNEIIMVDDSETDIFIMKKYIEISELKNEFRYFTSGQEFLDYMIQISQNRFSMPALVLLDINMPEMNGFEVLEGLRQYKDFKEFPVVIFFTSSDHISDKKKAESMHTAFQEKFLKRQDAVNFLNSLK